MRTEICEKLGIEFPIFAFSHCRDVVAAVSKAGGLGVLGAVGFSPEELEAEMAKHIPDGHRDFGKKVLADHGVPELPEDEKHHELLGWTAVTAAPQVEAILRHDKAKLVANAL